MQEGPQGGRFGSRTDYKATDDRFLKNTCGEHGRRKCCSDGHLRGQPSPYTRALLASPRTRPVYKGGGGRGRFLFFSSSSVVLVLDSCATIETNRGRRRPTRTRRTRIGPFPLHPYIRVASEDSPVTRASMATAVLSSICRRGTSGDRARHKCFSEIARQSLRSRSARRSAPLAALPACSPAFRRLFAAGWRPRGKKTA